MELTITLCVVRRAGEAQGKKLPFQNYVHTIFGNSNKEVEI